MKNSSMNKLMGLIVASATIAVPVANVQAEKLRMAYAASPVTVDPYRSSTAPSGSMNSHIYEGLLARTNDMLLATKFTWETPTRLVVDLRENVKFHNGADFTARDVVYSTCRMMYRVNGKNNVITNSLSPVTDVKALGTNKVVFETVKPYPLLVQKLKYLYIMSAGLGTDVPQNIKFDAKGDCSIKAYPTTADIESGKAAIGTGAFKLKSFVKNGTTKMVRNDNYWGQKSDWTELEISAVTNNGARLAGLFSGDYDLIVSPSLEDIEAVKNKKGFDYVTTPGWRSMFILMDVGVEKAAGVEAPNGKNPLNDVRVRKAMSMAIDRDAIVNRLLGGQGTVAKQLSPEYMNGAETGLPKLEYNPTEAKKLLAAAGYKNGFKLELYLPTDRYPNFTRLSQVVAQYWSRIGLKVDLKPQPWSVFSKTRKAGDLGAWMYGWGHPQGFTQMIIYNFPAKDKALSLGGHNHYTNYKNADVNKLMKKWAVQTDTNVADKYGREAMKRIVNDMGAIPLYYEHLSWAFRDGLTVKGRPDGFTGAKMVTKK